MVLVPFNTTTPLATNSSNQGTTTERCRSATIQLKFVNNLTPWFFVVIKTEVASNCKYNFENV